MSNAPWRIIAQRVLSGAFVDWDVPLQNAEFTRTLSGPSIISGTLAQEYVRLTADDGLPVLDHDSTALYVESDGEIRAGSLVEELDTDGPQRAVTTAGFSAYPNNIPFMDDYFPDDFEDPFTVYKNLWAYVQRHPDSALGVEVVGDPTWMLLSSGEGPWRVNWFDNHNCGQDLSQIAQTVPFDYIENHAWVDAAHTTISHQVKTGFPRLGRRRTDLQFEGGVNVTNVATVTRGGDNYANEVWLLGPGEGRAMLRASASKRDGRLRKVATVAQKAGTQGFLDAQVWRELDARLGQLDITGFTVSDHPSARLSAIQPGDDVRLRAEVEWEGEVDVWLRVLSVTESAAAPGQAVVKTQRSDSFVYSAAASPTGEPVLVTM